MSYTGCITNNIGMIDPYYFFFILKIKMSSTFKFSYWIVFHNIYYYYFTSIRLKKYLLRLYIILLGTLLQLIISKSEFE